MRLPMCGGLVYSRGMVETGQMDKPGFEILPQGVDGMIVRFAQELDEAANRRALSLAHDARQFAGVIEVAPGLASTFVRFDPATTTRAAVVEALHRVAQQGELPVVNGRIWHVPCCFAEPYAPQISEVASLAGITVAQVVAEIAEADLRVLAIGFQPGQPYLGVLPQHWNIPRQSGLTPMVPAGALTVAIRQCVLFAGPSPTGWRMIGRTGFRCFDLGAAQPFALLPGDRLRMVPVGTAEIDGLLGDPMGGARVIA